MDESKQERKGTIEETQKADLLESPAKCIVGENDLYFPKDSPPMSSNQEGNEPQTFIRGLKLLISGRKGLAAKEKLAEETNLSRSRSSSKRISFFKGRGDGSQKNENKNAVTEECVQKEPLSVLQINDLIQKRQLLKAFEHIRFLEGELLVEREAKKHEENLKEYIVKAKDVDLLYDSLSKEIQHIVEETLDLSSKDAEALITEIVALIEEEGKARSGNTNITLSSDPWAQLGLARNWRELWEQTVQESVKKRIFKVPIPLKENPSWLSVHLGFLKTVTRQDLLTIKNTMHKFYPDNYHVCDIYLKSFHEALSLHLNGILEANNSFEYHELHAMLNWVTNVYHSEDFLGHPDLQPEIKAEGLSGLLTVEVLDKLEKDYIDSVKRKTKSCLENIQILETKENWDLEEQPEALQSQYQSSLSFDIQAIIAQHTQASGKICKNLEVAVLDMSVKEVAEFIPCFGKAFLEQDKVKNYPRFASLMVAYLNTFHDLRMSLRTRFNVNCEELEKNLDDLILKYRKYFLNKLMLETQSIFQKILSQAWIIHSRTHDCYIMKVLLVVEDFSQHLQYLMDPLCKEGFLNEVHKFVVKEYITQILKSKRKMKQTKREEISKIMTQEATTISDTMMHLGSNADWLHPAIPHIVSIIREKKKEKIKHYIKDLAWNYPDIRKEHVMAILALRGWRRNNRQLIAGLMDGSTNELNSESGRTLFSEIELPNTIGCF